MSELSNRQMTMLKVLSLNNGYPINVGLSELIDKEFCDLMSWDYLEVHRGSDNVVWARITPKGVRVVPHNPEKEE